MERFRAIFSAAAIAAITFSVPIMAKAQGTPGTSAGGTSNNSGISQHQICKPGTPGCEGTGQFLVAPKQNIPRGFDRSAPSDRIGEPSNRLPRVRGPQPGPVSCEEASRILETNGYSRVRPVFCYGPNYTFLAKLRARDFIVIIRRSDGEILSASRVR